MLSEALWAYRISCHGSTKTSPYHLVYGQDVVLPWEITAGSRRVEFQNDQSAEQYAALMSDNVEDLTELRLWSLEKIKENKAKVARAYNKKVRPKEFQVGDLVWEAVLPITPGLQKDINRAIIYMPGSSHTYIQQNEHYITAHIT